MDTVFNLIGELVKGYFIFVIGIFVIALLIRALGFLFWPILRLFPNNSGNWTFKSFRCLFKGHNWEDWRYESDKNCNFIRICYRCGIKEYGGTKHNWGSVIVSAEFAKSGGILIVHDKYCERCNKKNRGYSHKWGERKSEFGGTEKYCIECGYVEKKPKSSSHEGIFGINDYPDWYPGPN